MASAHDSVEIVSSAEDPVIDLRNAEVYKKALFERDDQLLESLDGHPASALREERFEVGLECRGRRGRP